MLRASWAKPNVTSHLGNTLSPSLLRKVPSFSIHAPPRQHSVTSRRENEVVHSPPVNLVLAVTDPDAPSHENPEWSEVCHFLAYYHLGSNSGSHQDSKSDAAHLIRLSKSKDTLMPYKPPGPPPKTGKHRYVFVALLPTNRTTHPLHLHKPSERFRWGFNQTRVGLRRWAVEHGLSVVAANFIYAENVAQ